MVFRLGSRGSTSTRVIGRSGSPSCLAANVAVAQLSPGFAIDALITRSEPDACATEVIHRFWLSCQVTFVTKPWYPGTFAMRLMSVQLAPPLVVMSRKPPAAPTAMRLRSVGFTPRLYGLERNLRPAGR